MNFSNGFKRVLKRDEKHRYYQLNSSEERCKEHLSDSLGIEGINDNTYVVGNQEEGKWQSEIESDMSDKSFGASRLLITASFSVIALATAALFLFFPYIAPPAPVVEGGAWSSRADPFSVVNPSTLGFKIVERPAASRPGPVFGSLLNKKDIPLPTNNWYQNLLIGGNKNRNQENNAFQVPYIIDTAGFIPGIRIHPAHLQANDRVVMMTYEHQNGLTIGGIEPFDIQHTIKSQRSEDGDTNEEITYFAMSKLALELQWTAGISESSMRSPIVRGSPYVTMIYEHGATPRIFSERSIAGIIVDQKPFLNNNADASSLCSNKFGEFSEPFHVNSELILSFKESDMSWMVFLSRPMMFMCSNRFVTESADNLPPGVVPPQRNPGDRSYFELRAVKPKNSGSPIIVRIVMSNNCTFGVNAQHCDNWDSSLSGKASSNGKISRNNSELESIFRTHSDIFPSGKANIQFAFPVESKVEEELNLIFDWQPESMSKLDSSRVRDNNSPKANTELLMYALPHHQERIQSTPKSSNIVLNRNHNSNSGGSALSNSSENEVTYGETCLPTIHGYACLVVGGQWSLLEHLHKVSFTALSESSPTPSSSINMAKGDKNSIREGAQAPIPFAASPKKRKALLLDLHKSLKKDILYDLPENYRIGAGDTYFSGKMLAKLARILIIADENKGAVSDGQFKAALNRLKSRLDVWFNGSALSPFLYDPSWGGVVMCGCEYFYTPPTSSSPPIYGCHNSYPNCPAVVDAGHNFGAGFFNDHHYHFGYFIYAAAVAAKFDHEWALRNEDYAMFLIRDIGNPSYRDPYFPVWRHKDWYLGFSWASGVVTMKTNFPNIEIYPNSCSTDSSSTSSSSTMSSSSIAPEVVPYPNGRNQESSSEAIFAYEAMALFGSVMVDVYSSLNTKESIDKKTNISPFDPAGKLDTMQRVRDMGRLLLATEIRSAKAYYHVVSKASPGMPRIYPSVYKPKVVGMIWSLLAQEQTWFGNEPWKSYGIQLLPISPAAEQRDTIEWLDEMYPIFNKSCSEAPTCQTEGFSILLSTTLAALGRIDEAHSTIMSLDLEVFNRAGGNGHSLSNCLWWIMTRPKTV